MSFRTAAVEDALAIGLVGLVAGRAERGRGRAGDAPRASLCRSRSDRGGRRRPASPARARRGACRRSLHLAGGGKPRAQAFDDARERLIDDGGRAAGLADHRIAGNKIRHATHPSISAWPRRMPRMRADAPRPRGTPPHPGEQKDARRPLPEGRGLEFASPLHVLLAPVGRGLSAAILRERRSAQVAWREG